MTGLVPAALLGGLLLTSVPAGTELGPLLVEAAERGDRAAGDRALELLTEDASTALLRARVWLARSPPDLGRARELLLEARARGLSDPELALRLGLIAYALGEDETALAELQPLAGSPALSADGELALARILRRRGEADAALAACRRASALAPWSADAWHELATQLEGIDDRAAVKALGRALAADPLHRGARLARLRLIDSAILNELDAAVVEELVAAGEKEQPLTSKQVKRLVLEDPTDARWRVELADALLREGRASEALETLRRFETSTGDDRTRARAALLAQALGADTLAVELTERVSDPHALGLAHRARGAACLRLGNRDCALASLRIAVESEPWRADSRIVLAELLLGAAGGSDEALEQLRVATGLEPSDPQGWLLLGTLRQAVGATEAARAAFERALDADPESVAAHDQLGLLHHQAGRSNEAIEHLRRAVELAPRLRRVHYNLGGVLLLAGRAEEAVAALERACDDSLGEPAPPENALLLLAEARRRAER